MFVEPVEVVEVTEFSVISGSGGGPSPFLSIPTAGPAVQQPQQQFVVTPRNSSGSGGNANPHLAPAVQPQQQEHRDNHSPLLVRNRQPKRGNRSTAVDSSVASSSGASSTLDQLRNFLMTRGQQQQPQQSSRSSRGGRSPSPPPFNAGVDRSNDAPPCKRVQELRSFFSSSKNGRSSNSSRNINNKIFCCPSVEGGRGGGGGLLGMLHSIGAFQGSEQWQRCRRSEQRIDFIARQDAYAAAARERREVMEMKRTAEMRGATKNNTNSRSCSPNPTAPPLPGSAMPRRCSSAPTVSYLLRKQKSAALIGKKEADHRREAEVAAAFMPAITASARRMAATRVHESLFRDHARQQQRLEQRRSASREREMSSLPFAPVINNVLPSSVLPRRPEEHGYDDGGDDFEKFPVPSHHRPGAVGVVVTSALSDVNAFLREQKEREKLREQVRREVAAEKEAHELAGCTFRPEIKKLPKFVSRLRKL